MFSSSILIAPVVVYKSVKSSKLGKLTPRVITCLIARVGSYLNFSFNFRIFLAFKKVVKETYTKINTAVNFVAMT